ncbi:MAG: hypothetical protein AAF620_03320 [Bacteroidota bacterium]
MNYAKRKELINYLNHVEREYPVEHWVYNGIHIWPLLKMRIFNSFFHALNARPGVKSISRINAYVNFGIELIRSLAGLGKFKKKRPIYYIPVAETIEFWIKTKHP